MEREKDKKPEKKPSQEPDKKVKKTQDNRPDKKIPIVVLLLAFVVLGCALISSGSAASLSPALPAGANTSINATFFYGNGCSHCENVKPLVAALQTKYPELHVEMLEINDNKTNREKFLAMLLQYKLGDWGASRPSSSVITYWSGKLRYKIILRRRSLLKNSVSQPAPIQPR